MFSIIRYKKKKNQKNLNIIQYYLVLYCRNLIERTALCNVVIPDFKQQGVTSVSNTDILSQLNTALTLHSWWCK